MKVVFCASLKAHKVQKINLWLGLKLRWQLRQQVSTYVNICSHLKGARAFEVEVVKFCAL